MAVTFVRIGNFVLDVSISENHSFEADVTDFPVESGGFISDNIRKKPVRLTIEGVITDTPLASSSSGSSTIVNPYGDTEDVVGHVPAAQLSGHTLSNEPSSSQSPTVKFLRSDQAFEYLAGIWESDDVVVVRTTLGTFANMALERLEVPRNKDTTGGLKFTATFKQIDKVTNSRLGDARTSVRNGNGKKNKGSQAGNNDWYINDVLWSKGDPPGSYNIYEIEWIRWYWKPPLAGGGSAPALGNLVGQAGGSPQGSANTAVAEANTRSNHRWYHWSHPKKGVPNPIPLGRSEIAAFYKDRERDRLANLKIGNQVKNAANNITRQAETIKLSKANMAAQNELKRRDQAIKDATKAAGDPKFNNAANFVDTDPSPYQTNALKGTPKLR